MNVLYFLINFKLPMSLSVGTVVHKSCYTPVVFVWRCLLSLALMVTTQAVALKRRCFSAHRNLIFGMFDVYKAVEQTL